MKSLILVAMLALLAGCESRTEYGECVGLADKQSPKLEYKVSARNLVVGIVFIELIAPPVLVAVNETYCPVGKVEETK